MKYIKPNFVVDLLNDADVITRSDFYITDPGWFGGDDTFSL